MQQSLDIAHDLHFLLKEAALEGYTSMARWLGELEASCASGSVPLPVCDVPFATSLVHVQAILKNLEESNPNLFWDMGQKEECLAILKPFCRDTLKLNRKMDRISKMLHETVQDLEPSLIKFSKEETYLERVPSGFSSLTLTYNNTQQGSSQGSTGTLAGAGAKPDHPRKGVPTAIWNFMTCRHSNHHETKGSKSNRPQAATKQPQTPQSKPKMNAQVKQATITPTHTPVPAAPSVTVEAAPGETIPTILLPSETTLSEAPVLEGSEHIKTEDTEELEQKLVVVQWSDERMANWLEDNCIVTGAGVTEPEARDTKLAKQKELFAQIVSNADSKWFSSSEDDSKRLPEENCNLIEDNANEPAEQTSEPKTSIEAKPFEIFPLDPFNFLKVTVKELRSLVIRITFNLRLMERNFYAPPLKIMKSKRSDCRELKDYAAVVKEIGNEFEADQKATSPEEIELCQLLGTVYYQGLDCVKHFQKFSSMIREDSEFLCKILNYYRQGEEDDDYEIDGDDTPQFDLEPKVRTKLQDLFQ